MSFITGNGVSKNLTARSCTDSNQDFIRLIKKFTDVCMSSFPIQANPCYWDGLRVTLIRCLEGPPIGRLGLFHGVVFTVFHLLEGSVKMKKDGKSAEARKGQWIACQPGERFQDFSDSARILSIHLLIESPANATAWTGAPLVTLEADASLERRARRLRDTAILRRVRASGALTPQSEPATFPEMMALQEGTAAFFVRLLELLEMAGMRYDAPLIRDIRVRDAAASRVRESAHALLARVAGERLQSQRRAARPLVAAGAGHDARAILEPAPRASRLCAAAGRRAHDQRGRLRNRLRPPQPVLVLVHQKSQGVPAKIPRAPRTGLRKQTAVGRRIQRTTLGSHATNRSRQWEPSPVESKLKAR
jgi:hypothetical protein